jgi:hypothetical protein
MTGIATYGTAPYAAIKAVEPTPPIVLSKSSSTTEQATTGKERKSDAS